MISLVCRDNFSSYGLVRKGLLKSLALSIPPALALLALRIIEGATAYTGFNLEFPWNIFYASLAVFTYGPLEVFFIAWLIVNTDRVFETLDKTFSPGLLLTVVFFGLSHIILAPKGGVANALKVMLEFLVLSLIFKYTKNSLGPMVAWTIVNNQVARLLIGCLT